MAHFNPAKTQPIENARHDRGIVFGKLEIDGVTSISQGALEDLHSPARKSLWHSFILDAQP
jgi:hypothetical protein